MKRVLFTVFCTFALVSCSYAQAITLQKEAKLYERPSETAKVKATVPAGIILTRIATQGDWIAVSMESGISGWIQKSVLENTEGSEEDADELLRSLRDAANQAEPDPPPPANVPPPANNPQPANTPPPPANNPPANNPAAIPPPPAGNQPAVNTLPPPPPPRPPSDRAGSSTSNSRSGEPGISRVSRGLYNASQWAKVALKMAENIRGLNLTWARLAGAIAEINAWVDGFKFDPGTGGGSSNDGGDFFVDDGFGLPAAKNSAISSEGHTFYTLTVGAAANFYLMQPKQNMPVGLFAGGVVGLGRTFGEEVVQETNFAQYGGQGGAYAHFPMGDGDNLIIPRAAVQIVQTRTIVNNETFTDNATQIQLGLDIKFGSLIPGFMMTIQDEQQAFAFSLGFAY